MNLLSASFRLGRLFGIDVRVHILFLIYIGYELFTAGRDAAAMAAFMGLLFGIVLMHEFGHCFGARSVGGDAREILMWPLGGLAYAHAPMRAWPQFVTVACGPLVNLLLCLISGAIIFQQTRSAELLLLNPFDGLYVPRGPINWLVAVWILYQINLMLLAFNLLPIYPLDGGQLFQAIIWPFVGLQQATRIACMVGIAGCVALGVWGMQGGGQMLFFIAIFGGFTCYQRLQMLRFGMIIEDDRFTTYDRTGRYARRRGFWSRLFSRKRSPRPEAPAPYPAGRPSPNPNPGAWDARIAERDRVNAEVDRILQKVSERGVHSLTYVERQTLERATRERQQEERDLERRARQ